MHMYMHVHARCFQYACMQTAGIISKPENCSVMQGDVGHYGQCYEVGHWLYPWQRSHREYEAVGNSLFRVLI